MAKSTIELEARLGETEKGLLVSIQDLVKIQDSFSNQVDELKQLQERLNKKIVGL